MIQTRKKASDISSQLLTLVQILVTNSKLIWRINDTAGVRATYVAPNSLVFFDLVKFSYPVADIYRLYVNVIDGQTQECVVFTVDEPEHQAFLEHLWLVSLEELLPDTIPLII